MNRNRNFLKNIKVTDSPIVWFCKQIKIRHLGLNFCLLSAAIILPLNVVKVLYFINKLIGCGQMLQYILFSSPLFREFFQLVQKTSVNS